MCEAAQPCYSSRQCGDMCRAVIFQIAFISRSIIFSVKINEQPGFQKTMLSLLLAIEDSPRDGKCPALQTPWEVQLAYYMSQQPPARKALSSTQDRKGTTALCLPSVRL